MSTTNRLTDDNLLEPLGFDQYHKAQSFARDYRCAECQGGLVIHHDKDKGYVARCPKHGLIYSHNYISVHDTEAVEDGIRSGKIELRRGQPSHRDEEDIKKSLGF